MGKTKPEIVDGEIPFIRLVPGGPRVSLRGKRLAAGVGSKGVEPGQSELFVVSPQLTCVPIAFLFDEGTARDFELVNMTVSQCSMFINGSALPLAPFAGKLEGYPAARCWDITTERFANLLDLPVVRPGTDLGLFVRNTSAARAVFRGVVIFDTVP